MDVFESIRHTFYVIVLVFFFSTIGLVLASWREARLSYHEKDEETRHHPIFPSFRFLVCIISFLGLVCAQGSQALVGASLMLMVRHDDDVGNRTSSPGPGLDQVVVNNEENWTGVSNGSSSDGQDEWHFNWSRSEVGLLISSYFVSYYAMQFLVGYLTGRFGGYKVTLTSGSILAFCQVLSLWIPRCGFLPFAAVFAVSGAGNACTMAAVIAVLAQWCPPKESTRLMAMTMSGNSIGIALVFCLSTGTARIELFGGWPFNFIVMATIELVFLVLWKVFVTNTPGENKVCGPSEVMYIHTSFNDHFATLNHSAAVPWCKILMSPPVYAICASLFAADWFGYCAMSAFPTYFIAVQRMSKSMVALLTGLPWMAVPFVSFVLSYTVDSLREKHVLSTTALRKIADVTGKLLAGSFLLMAAYMPENHTKSTAALYALSILIIIAFQGSSWVPNTVELSPCHAGQVMAVAQVVSVPTSFIAPLLFGFITPNNSSKEWQSCFLITFFVCIIGTLIYVVCGSSKPQHWDN